MRILSIGNSFSQDAQRWLHQVAQLEGFEIRCVNLFIGGCSLERHWNNWCNVTERYVLEVNGVSQSNEDGSDFIHVTLQEALDMESWDVVTFQQVSDLCGIYESFQPYLSDLSIAVRQHCPNARFMIHQTWAYDAAFEGQQFAKYHFDQEEMYHSLCSAYEQAAVALDAGIIPSGSVIQALRETIPFNAHTGLSLNRDGFHMSFVLGRYALAVTWFAALIERIPVEDYAPPGSSEYDAPLRALIRCTVSEVMEERRRIMVEVLGGLTE